MAVKLPPDVQFDPPASGGGAVKLSPDTQFDPPAAGTWYGALGRGALHGAGNILYGGAQLGARMQEPTAFSDPDPTLAARVDEATRARQAAYRADPVVKAHPTAAGFGEVGGEIAATAPLMLLPGGGASAFARVAMAGLGGAGAAAMTPVTEGDYWHEKAKQVALGAAGGAGGERLLAVGGRLLAPKISEPAARLAAKDVALTAGQFGAEGGMIGRIGKRAEDIYQSVPILGDFIRGARRRSIESFNTATINQALDPIKAVLPKDVPVGTEAVKYAATEVGKAYDAFLPTIVFQGDRQFAVDLSGLAARAAEMPEAQATQLKMIVKNRLLDRMEPGGRMAGDTFKEVDSELRYLIDIYRPASDPAQKLLGEALSEVRSLTRRTLERTDPEAAAKLRNIDYSYAMLTRVEAAAGRRPKSFGVFSPTDLLSVVKTGDRSSRHREFAHGDALFQDWATDGSKILPSDVPDSGTATRAAYMLPFLGYGAHHFGLDPTGGLGAAAVIAGSSLPYTRAGQRVVEHYMTPAPWRSATGQVIGDIGTWLDPAFGIIAANQ